MLRTCDVSPVTRSRPAAGGAALPREFAVAHMPLEPEEGVAFAASPTSRRPPTATPWRRSRLFGDSPHRSPATWQARPNGPRPSARLSWAAKCGETAARVGRGVVVRGVSAGPLALLCQKGRCCTSVRLYSAVRPALVGRRCRLIRTSCCRASPSSWTVSRAASQGRSSRIMRIAMCEVF